jgi:hypothetical protein
MGLVRWPSSRCEEVCWVRWFMESHQFFTELHTDHEPRSDTLTLALSRREREYRGRFMGRLGGERIVDQTESHDGLVEVLDAA